MLRRITALAGTALLSGCTVFGIRSGYEQPPYDVVERLSEDVEIRSYAQRLAAETTVDAASEEEGRNAAFRILAGYIFGKNRSAQEIAMTAPVETRNEAGRVSMRFFLPSRYTRENVPQPLDERVRIVDAPPETVAVLRFSGGSGSAAIADRERELLRTLADTAWRTEGSPVALFYDPPWTLPFLRRNEVSVRVAR